MLQVYTLSHIHTAAPTVQSTSHTSPLFHLYLHTHTRSLSLSTIHHPPSFLSFYLSLSLYLCFRYFKLSAMDPALDPPPVSAQPTGAPPPADAPATAAANPTPAHSVPNNHPPYAEVRYPTLSCDPQGNPLSPPPSSSSPPFLKDS